MKLKGNMNKTSLKRDKGNEPGKDASVIRLGYNPLWKGLERDKDTRTLEEILKGFKVISEQDNATVFFKDDISVMDVVDESRVYIHIYSLGVEYLVKIFPYLVAKDNRGTNHYSYSEGLRLFLERYAYRLFLFDISVKEQKVLE